MSRLSIIKTLTFERELYTTLTALAEKQNRTFSNLVNTLLKATIEDAKKRAIAQGATSQAK